MAVDELGAPFSILTAILVGGWILYISVTTYIQYRRLAHVKGPWIAAISPLWLFYHTCRGDLYLAIHAGIQKYGSPLRVSSNIIATDDPVSQRVMAATKSPFMKGHWFKGMKFDPRVDNILSMTDESKHASMRTKLIPGYTGAEVPTLEPDIDARVIELIDLIDRDYVSQGKTFDFAILGAYFTLDVLTQIAFGGALGFITKNEDVFNYLQSSTDFYPIMELGSNHPWIYNFLKSPMMAGAQPKPTDKVGFGAVVGHTHKVVAERFGSDAKEKQDMLGSFVRHGLTQEECQSESLLQLLAGADSTSTALRTTMLYLLTSPYVYAKLLKEIKEAVQTGKASSPVINNSEAMQLPYLRAVIMEGLRMFMPLQGLAGRLPPRGGIDLNGVFIPEGTEVGIATYAMLKREDLFGKDADTFRPERWIEGDQTFIKAMEKNHELIFGYGRSSCLGKQIALMELRKTFFELLRTFDLVLVNAFKPMDVRSNSVVVQKNMIMRAYPRREFESS